MAKPIIMTMAAKVAAGIQDLVWKPLIQYTTTIMGREGIQPGGGLHRQMPPNRNLEWCEPADGEDPTTFPKAVCDTIMILPPVLLHQNPTIDQRPHNPDLFCLILCVAHNCIANAFWPKTVVNCQNWKRVNMAYRTKAFVNNFLAFLCIQYATNWSVMVNGALSIQALPDDEQAMAMRMAREFEKRFGTLLASDRKRSVTISANDLRGRDMKSFVNLMKSTVLTKGVSSVNYMYGANPHPETWTKEMGGALPFPWCYFLRQTLKGFDERCNENEEIFLLTTEEKAMLREQPIYCGNGRVPDDDDN